MKLISIRTGAALVLAIMVVVVVCVSEGVSGADSGAVSEQEGAALCALLHSTRGDSWQWRPEAEAGAVWNCSVDTAGGLVHNPCSHGGSSWQGVTCSSTPAECSSQVCQVTQLDLTSYEMAGPIPPEIGDLSLLNVIAFSNNHLTGSIPHKIAELTSLRYLTLSTNDLTGSIPSEIGELQALTLLDFSALDITGNIPVGMWQLTALQLLYLQANNLNGPIPHDVGKLALLNILALYDNQLTGSIPGNVGELTSLRLLYLQGNQLTGSIPREIGKLINLDLLYLNSNLLTGPIPLDIGQATALQGLFLNSNQLTGPIPNTVENLHVLRNFVLYFNQLTGPIPKGVGNMSSLVLLYAYDNLLTGSIPDEVGECTALAHLILDNNLLTGIIPLELEKLSVLEILYLNSNILSGPLPGEVVHHLTALQQLVLDNNHLTGSIPVAIGQLIALERLYLYANQVIGTIPSTIGALISMDELKLQDNRLSGTLPSEISRLKKLKNFFLQNNFLTGHLGGVFNHSIQLELVTIDVSNNLLEGSIVSEICLLPKLRVLSLSVNCFKETLMSNICYAEGVEVLSLNGLRAATGCTDSVVLPVSGVALFNTIGGTIPPCLWSLRNLSVLHLTGNGLSGVIVPSLSDNSQLSDVSLSHNQLSGTIPLDILEIDMLDLSHNQFEGEYVNQKFLSTNIYLEINRLSGHLPMSGFESRSNGSLSVLRGNMFSCRTVPEIDEYSHDYVCGSRIFNYSLFVYISAVGVVAMLLILFYWCSRTPGAKGSQFRFVSFLHASGTLLGAYVFYIRNLDKEYLRNKHARALYEINLLSDSFLQVIWGATQLVVVILVCCLPLYLVKAVDSTGKYATHSHTYSWFLTVAYMRGIVPAGLLLLAWLGAIGACTYRIVIRQRDDNQLQSESFIGVTQKSTRTPTTRPVDNSILLIGAGFAFNAAVIVTVNAFYIYSTQQALGAVIHFGLQLSLSIFRLIYAAIAIPLLSRNIRSVAANVKFRFMLLAINNLLIPCVVTALTSDACFQGLLIPADEVRTPYSYRSCLKHTTDLVDGVTMCVDYGTVDVDSVPLTPPFTYNNQCGSVLLTSYIPVLLLGYSLQLLLPVFVLVLQIYLPIMAIPSFIRHASHGIIWPDHWLQDETSNHNIDILDSNQEVLLKIRTIYCNDVLNNWLIMLTFGLCSPVLALAVVFCILLKMLVWVMLVGRFLRYTMLYDSSTSSIVDTSKGNAVSVVLKALGDVHIPLFNVLASSFWRLAWYSAVFVGLLGWDLAADDVGWIQSLWVPVTPLGMVLILRFTAKYVNSNGMDSKVFVSVERRMVCDNICDLSRNPMHDNDKY